MRSSDRLNRPPAAAGGPPGGGSAASAPIRRPAALPAFALTIFTGAFLLFQVQPLIGKYILPWFGGSPSVWTTCLLFFQALLLGGYAYAHALTRVGSVRRQALVHAGLLVAALVSLPITPSADWKPSDPEHPTGRILLLLTVSLGLPYLALAATGPLMQKWYSQLNPGHSPYRLYALSNLGSLLALISYPLVFEPALSRGAQAACWSGSLGVFALLCGWCAARLWRAGPTPAGDPGPEPSRGGSERPAAGTRRLWLGLPAVASVLLLATTNRMCLDVAVIPFLWVLPLGLYLLSFILCFDRPGWYRRPVLWLALLPALSLLIHASSQGSDLPLLAQIGFYSGSLFVCCMVCHGELYRLRPAPGQLTAYYLWIAAGGALGGLFVTVAAPVIFDAYWELQCGLWLLLVLLAIICRREKLAVRVRGERLPVLKFVGVALVGLSVALALEIHTSTQDSVYRTRNFYGVLRVLEYDRELPESHAYILRHGGITHGLQFVNQPQASWPTAYFYESSGVGLALRHLPRQADRRVGVVGLGIGTLAAYARAGDVFRFYEINPAMRELAETRFRYLANCTGRVEVVLGDARLRLEREPPQNFDLLVLDAFTGDALPVHLLTRQALEIYLRHLGPDGVLAVNISNRHLHLWPVVEKLAAHAGLHAAAIPSEAEQGWQYTCRWALLARRKAFLDQEPLRRAARLPVRQVKNVPLWTDDYASVFPLLD